MSEKINWVHTTEVLQEWGQKLIEEYRFNLAAGDNNATHNLEKSLKYFVRKGKSEIELTLNLEDYYKFLERGRGKTINGGDGVVVKKIAEWITVKHILPRPDEKGKLPTPMQLAYAIAQKIHKEGYKEKGQPLQNAMDSVKTRFETELQWAIQKDVTENVQYIIKTYFSAAPSILDT